MKVTSQRSSSTCRTPLVVVREDLTELHLPPLKQMLPQLAGTRKAHLAQLATVSLFITDDLVIEITQRRPKIFSERRPP
jgi:hypothetical protein